MAPFKSSDGRSLGKLLEGFKTSTLGQGFGSGGGAGGSFSASGGVQIAGSDGYTYHVFQYGASGNLIVNSGLAVANLLLIGAGGGGGSQHAGGGGAGALYYNPTYVLQPGTYSITVGAGGAGKVSNSGGSNGGATTFGDITVDGGGLGGVMGATGGPGGCGAGGGMNVQNPFPGTSNTTGGAATGSPTHPNSPLVYANVGGTGSGYYAYSAGGLGGGGGGAGGGGGSAPPGPGPSGNQARGGDDWLWTDLPQPVIPSLATGLGTPTTFLGVPVGSPINLLRAFGGGGAGGSHSPWDVYNNNGRYSDSIGGGGSLYSSGGEGGTGNVETGWPGVNGRGGGGGGSGATPLAGGTGGHGIVIVRYETP